MVHPWRRSLHTAFANTVDGNGDEADGCQECPPCLLNLPCSWQDDDPDSFMSESDADNSDLHPSDICSSSLPTSAMTAALIDYEFEKFTTTTTTTIYVDQDRQRPHVHMAEAHRAMISSHDMEEGLEYYFHKKEGNESIDSIAS